MPDPNAVASPTSTSWLDDVEGANTPFSELFGTEGGSQEPAATPSTPEAAPTTSAPQATSPSFSPIRTKTGTVYNTVEDATRGIEEKDTLIRQLRERYTAERGVDPITNEPVRRPEAPFNYMQDPQRFAKDLAAAASKNDAATYTQVQTKLIFDALQPIAPIIQDFARRTAQETVTSEIKEFPAFRNSADFNQVLEANPVLKGAIEGAEGDVRFSSQLPGLYKLAYAAHTLQKQPDLIKALQTQNTPTQTTPTPNRTMSTSTIAPTTPSTASSDEDLMQTSEGRRELMTRYKSQGFDNFKF